MLPSASGAAMAPEAGDPDPLLLRPRARSHSTCSIVCAPSRWGAGLGALQLSRVPIESPPGGLTELPSRGEQPRRGGP